MDVVVPSEDNPDTDNLPDTSPLEKATSLREALHVIVRETADDRNGKSVLICSHQNREFRVAVPADLSPPPHKGDHLLLTSSSTFLEDGDIEASAVQYTRQREDVLVRLTDVHQANNGQHFVFEKNACCDVDAMPDDAVLEVGMWFKVSLVESRQPKWRQWRAYGAKRVLDNDIDAAENANDLEGGIAMTRLLDFGQVTFGEVSTRPITIQNVDTSGPHTMVDRLSVGGCPIRLISPVNR